MSMDSIASMRRQLSHLQQRVRPPKPKRPATFKKHHEDMGDELTFGQRLAEQVAGFIGSWTFLGGQALVLAAWVAYNGILVAISFDRPPYILLNLMLSFEAAFSAPMLLIAANVGAQRDHAQAKRIEELAARNAEHDANLDAEVAAIHKKLDALAPPAELPRRKSKPS